MLAIPPNKPYELSNDHSGGIQGSRSGVLWSEDTRVKSPWEEEEDVDGAFERAGRSEGENTEVPRESVFVPCCLTATGDLPVCEGISRTANW